METKTICAAIAAICAAAALPSYARTITVTGYDVGTRTATLAFEGTAAGVECLYVAYGNTDYGESIGVWPNKVRLDANLAADATSGEYVLPAAATGCFRFFTGTETTLPYDYEVAYLESTGTQYIDTGLVGAWGDVWNSSFRFTQASPSGCFIAGAWPGKSGSTRYTPFQFDGTKFITVVNGTTTATVTADTSATCRFTASITSGSQTLDVNGVQARATVSGTLANTTATTYIFARNATSKGVDGHAQIQLDYLKLWQNGALTLDLVPVVSNNVGYLYNKVDGAMFGNKGTGSFVFDASTKVADGGTVLQANAVSAPSFAGALSVTSIDWAEGEATLSFPALPAAATLWAAYAVAGDPGADSPNAWDKYVKLADLAVGSTGGTYSFSELAGASHTYKSLRFMIAGSGDNANLFDYEVKYLESDGTQYVDTGIVGGWDDVWSGNFRFASTASGFIAGSRKGNSERYTVLQWNGSSFVVLADANVSQNVSITPAIVGTGVDYEFSVAFYNGFQSFNVNGTAKPLYCYGAIKNNNTPVHLFHRHGASADDGPAKIQMDWFKLVRNGSTALDLVPAVKNGKGGFYNKANGEFLGVASGSADFDVDAMSLLKTRHRTGFAPFMTSEACAENAAVTVPVITCTGFTVNALGVGTVAWTLDSAGVTASTADIYYVIDDTLGHAVTNQLVSAASVGSGTAAISNLFAATSCQMTLFAQSADGRSDATFPRSFTNTGTASLLNNSAFLVSADAGVVSVAGALSVFGSGVTYAWVEHGAASGALDGVVALPALENDGASATQEYAMSFAPSEAEWTAVRVYAKIVCSNVVEGVFGPLSWTGSATSVKNATVLDTSTYTWIGGASGTWSDTTKWRAEGVGHFGYPRSSGSTAAFAANTAAAISLDADVSISNIDVTAGGAELTFQCDPSTNRTLACGLFADLPDGGTRLSFDRVSFTPNAAFDLASGSSLTILPGTTNLFRNHFGACTDNDSDEYHPGEIDIRPGASFVGSGIYAALCLGGESLLRIGGTVDVHDVTYGYFSMGGGTIQIYGAAPSLTIARSFRAKLKATDVTRNVDAHLEFLLPPGGYGSENAVIKGLSTSERFGGSDSQLNGLNLKLRISVPDESPAFSASPRKASAGDHLLIDWPGGINTNGVELVNGGQNKQRLFYTWSKDPTDTTPPAGGGLPKYVWVNYTAPKGIMIIVK